MTYTANQHKHIHNQITHKSYIQQINTTTETETTTKTHAHTTNQHNNPIQKTNRGNIQQINTRTEADTYNKHNHTQHILKHRKQRTYTTHQHPNT